VVASSANRSTNIRFQASNRRQRGPPIRSKGQGSIEDGYALLELTATPGIWHEECLEWVEQDCNW
jgi:hypothetical protein